MRYIISILTILNSILASYAICNNGKYLNIFYICLSILVLCTIVDAVNARYKDIELNTYLDTYLHYYSVTVFDSKKNCQFTCPKAFQAKNCNEASILASQYYKKISGNDCVVIDIKEAIFVEKQAGGENGKI